MYLYIRNLEHVSLSDIDLVGGKNASLGEMISALSSEGIAVPGGFVVTADAYSLLIARNKDTGELEQILNGIKPGDLDSLVEAGKRARNLIREGGIPEEVKAEIARAYMEMERTVGNNVAVAVRSSATAEDLPDASFAGQQESYINVRGVVDLLDACLDCYASLFTDRAISYRNDKGFDHMAVRLSIGVQQMVRSDLATSGVIFTLDPESGHQNVILVTSAYGLGENVVAGRVDPDEILVFKPTLNTAPDAVIRRKVGKKQYKMILKTHGCQRTKNVDVLSHEREMLSISDADVMQLSRWALKIEEHYSQRYQRWTPMDIEWAKDGLSGDLYIVQARPETIHKDKTANRIKRFSLAKSAEPLVTGKAIGEAIGIGKAKVIHSPHELNRFNRGEVLVADMTDPDWEPIMKQAAAIVTNRGGRTCHAAIISRELGVPCIVGTGNATQVLSAYGGHDITVSCSEGALGHVYEGVLPYTMEELVLDELPAPRTALMLNVGNPESALKSSLLPCAGVGLAREEFIIAHEVKVHPMALVHPEMIEDGQVREQIGRLTNRFPNPEDYFVCKLAEGVATIAAAFYPRPVIVRLSDFKTNEYASLLGGKYFEPKEENPMIGFRGACRYSDERYREGFRLECQAIKKVRSEMGLDNVKLMVPFCRTPEEGRNVINEMAANGLVQGENGLEIYVMCELPCNVLSINAFAAVFDGFSIGSNDLTQLVLGVDRDSEVLACLFNEQDAAVKCAMSMAIAGAKAAGKKIGICGQAPSDYPEVVRFLIEEGIDSISLNEDAYLKTLMMVSKMEGTGHAKNKKLQVAKA
jgi:pyruvate,water dikinase